MKTPARGRRRARSARQRCCVGPEEIDAAQEADEQRRIAERGERAADIGDQDDEEHDDVHVVEPRRIGAQQRADQDHGRAGGADDARDQRAEGEDRGVDERRAAQIAGHQNAAGDHVEREQQHDEAQIFAEHRVHEGGDRRRHAVERRQRRERQRRPDEGELAVVAVPEAREQQRPGRDREQDADERQRPRPAQRRAVERRRRAAASERAAARTDAAHRQDPARRSCFGSS